MPGHDLCFVVHGFQQRHPENFAPVQIDEAAAQPEQLPDPGVGDGFQNFDGICQAKTVPFPDYAGIQRPGSHKEQPEAGILGVKLPEKRQKLQRPFFRFQTPNKQNDLIVWGIAVCFPQGGGAGFAKPGIQCLRVYAHGGKDSPGNAQTLKRGFYGRVFGKAGTVSVNSQIAPEQCVDQEGPDSARAVAFYHTGRLRQALEEAERALALEPSDQRLRDNVEVLRKLACS